MTGVFHDPTGQPNYGLGICDRCRRTFFLSELHRDPNSPGLRVCVDDMDQFDPYRLPARQSERINLPFTRPEVPLQGFQEDPGGTLYSEIFASQATGDLFTTESGDFMEWESGL